MSIDKDKYIQLVKSIADGKDIIPSIHNYCDRWCERCTHTSHCSVFKIEQEMNYSNEEMDIQNEKFWESLSMIYKATFEMLHEKMQEFGIDPDSVESANDDDNFITKPLNSEAVEISKNYAYKVAKWLETNRDHIIQNFELHQNINEKNALEIADSIDVIQHYFMMVATKTYRASLVYEDDDEQYDALGSAKLNIIIIDRSIAAWTNILKYFPNFEDDILLFLKTLSKIKKLLFTTFPKVMEFKRPGFD